MSGRSARVLVVEDEESIRQLVPSAARGSGGTPLRLTAKEFRLLRTVRGAGYSLRSPEGR